ncbi:MAG: hypothetical protein VYE59_00495 [Candidatus Thermoplasmatota archaeon]|nr:hypothetical protein [Candidatus Thermoplasmatota archaeon]MEE3134734.1 hypothetical protein [Candidatus Thermoplasmatota archaeon]CAI8254448.1 MAG: Uncharacterised protein [Euryarchaeota archaeon]
MTRNEYTIQELLKRDVYVGDTKVGVIIGERNHPNVDRVRSMRISVESDIADEFMRKPAEMAPLSKELVHSIMDDGSVKLSKSMRELQRRWRNTVRIDENLYAPDEMEDRAVQDNQGDELGVIVGLLKKKRTYRGVVVETRPSVRRDFGLPEKINIPISAFAKTRESLDEVVLSRTISKLLTLPSYIQINDPNFIDEDE